MVPQTRSKKFDRYRAAIAKIDERDLVTPPSPTTLDPLPDESEEENNGVHRGTRSIPLDEIIKGAGIVAGNSADPGVDTEKQQNRSFVVKVILVCLLTAILIVAVVIWIM